MNEARRAILSDLEQNHFPNIAALWRPFLEQGCNIYLLSDEGYKPRDGYALFWIGRYLAPLATEVELVPVYGGLNQISSKNLIILGMLRSFMSQVLEAEVLRGLVYNYAHLHFIDNERLFQIDTGDVWSRTKDPRWIRDYGVLRMWQQKDTGRTIIHCAGLGPVGTLGASLAITDPSRLAMKEVETRLLSLEEMQQNFIEILVKADWEPKLDPLVVNPSDVTIKVERGFHLAAEPNWPVIHFQRAADNGDWLYEVKVTDTKGDTAMMLSQNKFDFAVLAAIAKHTEKEPSWFVGKGGYLSYKQIAESEIVKKIFGEGGLYADTVRTLINRLRSQTFETPEWKRTFPNLLLESTTHAIGSKRKIKVLRLRAKFKWWDT